MFTILRKHRIYNKIQPEKKHNHLSNYKAQRHLYLEYVYKHLLVFINKKSEVKFLIAPSYHILFLIIFITAC